MFHLRNGRLIRQLSQIFPSSFTEQSSRVLIVGYKELQGLFFHTSCLLQGNNFNKRMKKAIVIAPKTTKKIVSVWKNMTTEDLVTSLGKDLEFVRNVLRFIDGGYNYMAPIANIDNIQISLNVVKRSGFRCKIISNPNNVIEAEINYDILRRPPAQESELVKRHPVVTIMGHVDHGKTTLLDALRDSNIVDSEFGGITQHVGAFSVKLSTGEQATFLDTPGHAAFSAIRERGANATDIVVLVVAADDGVMAQTKESIHFANMANVPIIVAINKIDKLNADIPKTRLSLGAAGIQLEEDGGETQGVEISAIQKTNIHTLVEALALQAEILELKSDPRGLVEGVVIESNLHPGRGKIATCIIQRGTLRKGTILIAGTAHAKVRIMLDEFGETISEAPPSTPVQVVGWKELPSAGDEVLEVDGSIQKAEAAIKWRKEQINNSKKLQDFKEIQAKVDAHNKAYKEARNEKLASGYRFGWKKRTQISHYILNKGDEQEAVMSILIKCDVDGSCEAILDIIDTYNSDLCKLDVINYGIGPIIPSDIELASSFNGIIYTFNVPCSPSIKQSAIQKNVKIVENNIIYRLIENLKDSISDKIPCKKDDFILGEAVVQTEFLINDGRKKIPVAGCRCEKGSLIRSKDFKVKRNDEIIHTGSLSSLRHHKNEVPTVNFGIECGVMFADTDVRFENGDKIICYEVRDVPQKCDWDPPGF